MFGGFCRGRSVSEIYARSLAGCYALYVHFLCAHKENEPKESARELMRFLLTQNRGWTFSLQAFLLLRKTPFRLAHRYR